MASAPLYIITVLIWGSTWLAIKWQLGEVEPTVSIAHRFGIAAAIMLLLLWPTGRLGGLSLRDHGFAALQGATLFCINYLFIYSATADLTSGLVAVVFSCMVILNVINGGIFLRLPVQPGVILGGVLGIAGMVAVFLPEFAAVSLSDQTFRALLLCIAGTASASIGNIVAARNNLRGLPVLACNTWGMVYGAVLLYALALVLGHPITIEPSARYIGSLLYLSLVGSILAFWAYVTLIGRIGPGRASYTSLWFPLVALALSTWLEGYQWTALSAGGLALVIVGNWLAMRGRVA